MFVVADDLFGAPWIQHGTRGGTMRNLEDPRNHAGRVQTAIPLSLEPVTKRFFYSSGQRLAGKSG
jgi:hypothetical protein